jgi:hypothetical protein
MKGDGSMKVRRTLAAVVVLGFAVAGCDYIVPPVQVGTPPPAIVKGGWQGFVTAVADVNGSLHVELAIQNNNSDWAAIDVARSTASITDKAGKSTTCDKVFVGTSVFQKPGYSETGWFLPPGFVMKGYTGGTKAKPVTQLESVDCAGVAKAAGLKLTVKYTYVMGPYNYYRQSDLINDEINLDLDNVTTDVTFPRANDKAKAFKVGEPMVGLNDFHVTLTAVARSDEGFTFAWHADNPNYIHIGTPPVIGDDGILYGFYESPHLSTPPLIPAADDAGNRGTADWTTKIAVPKTVMGCYILVPLESNQNKYFIDQLIDITGQSEVGSTLPPAAGSGSPGAPAASKAPAASSEPAASASAAS